ncbi:MAG: YmdB family metallophosphoesterase [Planctomycetota bacterium]
MRILCLGDIVGAPGREILAQTLPGYREEQEVDLVVANIENVARGSGVTPAAFRAVRAAGVDVCTSGDHVFKRSEVAKIFRNEPERMLRPLNYPARAPGRGATVVVTGSGARVAVTNVQGRVMLGPADDPFRALDVLRETLDTPVLVVDVHAEATSEKRALGWYLDGRASIVFGTHTHVPTADEEVLPGGTAYITDVGMCGPYDSVIGRRTDRVLEKFTTNVNRPFDVATGDPRACGVLAEVDAETGKASSIERVVLRPRSP